MAKYLGLNNLPQLSIIKQMNVLKYIFYSETCPLLKDTIIYLYVAIILI